MTPIREGLLDALEALAAHRDAVVVVGAQAVYLHVGDADLYSETMTKDSDLAIDPDRLTDDPLVDRLMRDAGFDLVRKFNDKTGKEDQEVGRWQKTFMQTSSGVDVDMVLVDLMVPEALAPGVSTPANPKRDSRVKPHAKRTMRRASGLEAAISDCVEVEIGSLPGGSGRQLRAKVATPAALVVAKMIKIRERNLQNVKQEGRLKDKDALDVFRLLRTVTTEDLADGIRKLLTDPLAGDITRQAMDFFFEAFASSPQALGCSMVVGSLGDRVIDAEQYGENTYFLALDLMDALNE